MRLRRAAPLALALLASLATAGEASADDCVFTGPSGGSWHTDGNWECGAVDHVPTAADNAVVGPSASVSVSVAAAAEAGSLTHSGGTITFSGDVTLAAGSYTAASDGNAARIEGAGTLTVSGAFTKAGNGQFSVGNSAAGPSADLVLDGAATLDEGEICVARNDGSNPDQPNLQINDTFTIANTDAASEFSCSTNTPTIHINPPDGHLIKPGTGAALSHSVIDNDDQLTVQGGSMTLLAGTGGQSSDGAYVADAGASLQFGSCCAENFQIGATGRVGGNGTINLSANPITLAAGATLDPATLNINFGVLVLNGTSALTLADVNITGSALDTDRPLTATALDITGTAAIRGTGSVTVPTGGSFTKTGSGTLSVSANLNEAAADLTLNVDATLAGGSICAARSDGSHPDLPNIHINQDFTIGAGADALWYPCGGGEVHVNGPSGTLSKAGVGTSSSNGAIDVAGGAVTIASGQIFSFFNAYAQSGGTTTVQSGGVLDANATLTGGTLQGSGEVDGNVTNTSGTVAPGTSAGTLTVDGAYIQGAGGTLRTEVAGTTPGTQFDLLSVTGAATLNGTVAVVQGAGFEPQLSDTFQFLTSASRTGTFASLTNSTLPSGNGYALDYPGAPNFGARLEVVDGPPPSPTFTDTDPDSPADDNQPLVKGNAPPGAHAIRVYKTANCTGPVVEIPASDFASHGAPVNVPDNSSTTFHGITVDSSANVSACSTDSITYVEQTDPPPPPTFTDTDPDSPADDNQPLVKGNAPPGAHAIRVYKTADCTGAVVEIPASDFASHGAPVNVPDNSRTTFHGITVDTSGNISACSSSSITYVEDSTVGVGISIGDVASFEGNSGVNPLTFLVRLNRPAPTGGVSVDFETADGRAKAPGDFRVRSGRIEFDEGERSKEIAVLIRGDSNDEQDESLSLKLSNPIGATLTNSQGGGRIQDDDDPPKLTAEGPVIRPEGDSGRTVFPFIVALDHPAPEDGVKVDYATVLDSGSQRSSAEGSDFEHESGVLSFAEGQQRKTLKVLVNGDRDREADEDFKLRISDPRGAAIRDSAAVGTIENDDERGTGTLPGARIGNSGAPEGDTGVTSFDLTVSLSGPAPPGGASIDYRTLAGTAAPPLAGVATAGADFVDQEGTVTVPAGESAVEILVSVLGDTEEERTEYFYVDLVRADGADLQGRFGSDEPKVTGVVEIRDDDFSPIPKVEATNLDGPEGDSGLTVFPYRFQLTHPAPAGGVGVEFKTIASTAQAGRDFVVQESRVMIPEGERSATVTIQVRGDTVIEPREVFAVVILRAEGAVLGPKESGTVEIDNDDGVGPVATINDVSHSEGDSGNTSFTFRVSISGPAPPAGVDVDFQTIDGTARAPGDYTHREGTVTIPAGEDVEKLVVQVHGDTQKEPEEGFRVRLTGAEGAVLAPNSTGTGVIRADDF